MFAGIKSVQKILDKVFPGISFKKDGGVNISYDQRKQLKSCAAELAITHPAPWLLFIMRVAP